MTLHDENDYKQRCLDLGYDLGMDIVREGGAAVIDLGIPNSGKVTIAHPRRSSCFWKDTWEALQASFPDRKI